MVEFKKDAGVIVTHSVLVVVLGALVYVGKVDWTTAAAFLAAAGVVPAFIGRKQLDDRAVIVDKTQEKRGEE